MNASDLLEAQGLLKARKTNLEGLQSIDENGWINLYNQTGGHLLTLDHVSAAVWGAVRDAIRARNAVIDARLVELGVEPDA